MNKYAKEFLRRGALFAGLGPIVAASVFYVLSLTLADFSLSGGQMLTAVVTTYLLAFVQAGASVFHQIDHWSLPKAMLCHLGLLYAAYVSCYLLNSWIPFEWTVIGIFTVIFVVGYFAIWLITYLSVRAVGRRMNQQLK